MNARCERNTYLSIRQIILIRPFLNAFYATYNKNKFLRSIGIIDAAVVNCE